MEKKRNKNYRVLKTVFVSILILGSILLIVRCCPQKQTKIKPYEPNIMIDKYDVLAEVWNKFVSQVELGEKFYLIQSDPDETVKRLNSLLKPFFSSIPKNVGLEFQKLRLEEEYSFFNYYHDFLSHYAAQDKHNISINMSSLEIKDHIYDLTKKNDIDKKTIQIVASMHDHCIFFKTNKLDLYKKGLDRRITNCQNISLDETAYPHLYAFLFN